MNHEIKSNKETKPRKPKNKIKVTGKNKTICACVYLKKFPSIEKKYLLQQSKPEKFKTKVPKKLTQKFRLNLGKNKSPKLEKYFNNLFCQQRPTLKKGKNEKHLKHKKKKKD